MTAKPTDPTHDGLTRAALMFVMVAALAVGTWSIYTLLTERFGAPKVVAFLGCAMFDGASLFFARLAQRYAATEDSGLAPRLAMLTTVSASAWVNWTHAHMEGWGTVGGVVLGGAPIVAEVAFELHHRYEHRDALRQRGRVPQALPVLGRWAWLLHPRKAFRVVDAHVEARMDDTAAAADRITLTRDDAPPHHPAAPAPQHLIITIEQPAAITAAPAHTLPPHPAPAQHDAPVMRAGQGTDAPMLLPAAPLVDADRAADDALRGKDLNKTDAVRAVRAALPASTAPQVVQHLARHGISIDDGYVRTVFSRDKKRATDKTGTGYYP